MRNVGKGISLSSALQLECCASNWVEWIDDDHEDNIVEYSGHIIAVLRNLEQDPITFVYADMVLHDDWNWLHKDASTVKHLIEPGLYDYDIWLEGEQFPVVEFLLLVRERSTGSPVYHILAPHEVVLHKKPWTFEPLYEQYGQTHPSTPHDLLVAYQARARKEDHDNRAAPSNRDIESTDSVGAFIGRLKMKSDEYSKEVGDAKNIQVGTEAAGRIERAARQIADAGGLSSEEKGDLAAAIASRLQESKLTVAGARPTKMMPTAGATVRLMKTTGQEQVLLPVFGKDGKTRYVFSVMTDPAEGPSGAAVVEDIGALVQSLEIMFKDYSLIRVTGRSATKLYKQLLKAGLSEE